MDFLPYSLSFSDYYVSCVAVFSEIYRVCNNKRTFQNCGFPCGMDYVDFPFFHYGNSRNFMPAGDTYSFNYMDNTDNKERK